VCYYIVKGKLEAGVVAEDPNTEGRLSQLGGLIGSRNQMKRAKTNYE